MAIDSQTIKTSNSQKELDGGKHASD